MAWSEMNNRSELPQQISTLFDTLRAQGFLIGVDQYISAKALVADMIFADAVRDGNHLRNVLSALISKSPSQKAAFNLAFDSWFSQIDGSIIQQPGDDRPKVNPENIRPISWISVLGISILTVTTLVGIFLFYSTIADFVIKTIDATHDQFTDGILTTVQMVLVGIIAVVGPLGVYWFLGEMPKPYFVRRHGSNPTSLTELAIYGKKHNAISEAHSRRIAHGLSHYETVSSLRIDPTKTAISSATYGLPNIIFADIKKEPNYLVLVDVASASDHLSALASVYCTLLEGHGLKMEQYRFRGTPSRLTGPDGRRFNFGDIVSNKPECRLVIISDGTGWGIEAQSQLPTWVAAAVDIKHKAVLTPLPTSSWGSFEASMRNAGFFVDFLEADGLLAFARSIKDSQPHHVKMGKAGLFPRMLQTRTHRWLDDLPPDDDDIDTLLAQLRLYLGESGYRWLQATAVFPKIVLPITTHIRLAAGGELEDLPALVALPWFRRGRVPDWLRLRLVEGLEADIAGVVRNELEVMFEPLESRSYENKAILHIAKDNSQRSGQLGQSDHQNDYIFVEFMANRKIGALTLATPPHIRSLLQTNKIGREPQLPLKNEVNQLSRNGQLSSNISAAVAKRSKNQRLIVLCDGTWNSPTISSPTHISSLMNALSSNPDHEQSVYYISGVGAATHLKSRISRLLYKIGGGAFGWGIEKGIKDAYEIIAKTYQHGDEIYLFGVDRGAFTARSVAGMIRKSGIVKDQSRRGVNRAFKLYKSAPFRISPDDPAVMEARREISPTFATSRADLDWRADDSEIVNIAYVGVWDTVGALGLPTVLLGPIARLSNRRLEFHDTQLSTLVKSGRHAVALDEKRILFEPTLWSNLDELNDGKTGPNRPYQQLWFVGDHGILGGTSMLDSLSAIPFRWVLEGAPRLTFGADRENLFSDPDPLAGAYELDRPQGPLNAWRVGPSDESDIHESVRVRFNSIDSYRPASLNQIRDQIEGARHKSSSERAG